VAGVMIIVCITLILLEEICICFNIMRVSLIICLSVALSRLLGQDIGCIIFFLAIAELITFGIWVKIKIYKADREEALEQMEYEKKQIETVNRVINCYWSFVENGERYCCKNDEIIKQSLSVCRANCKGFTQEDAIKYN
ncbi:MAG: hypothetical protein ACRCX2_07895, partial [Paraclostridium sp.]